MKTTQEYRHWLEQKKGERNACVKILRNLKRDIQIHKKEIGNLEKAVEVVNLIEPRIVIPMHYKIEGLNLDIKGADEFIKEMGLKAEKIDVLKIDKKSLPQEETRLVVLNKA